MGRAVLVITPKMELESEWDLFKLRQAVRFAE
jgi:hypothetical protein